MISAHPMRSRYPRITLAKRQADAALDSHTTGAEVARHCGRYEQYLNTGVVPQIR